MALLNAYTIPGNNRDPRTLSAWWLGVVIAFLFAGTASQAQPASAREYQIKAAFLFNFSQFVEWPPDAFADAQAPLIIGVLGNDPFGPFLNEAVNGEKSGLHPIVIERYQRAEEASRCHILFISYTESEELDLAFACLKGRSVLTVGDAQGFATHGGMIRFMTVNKKIRLRVNVEAAKSAGLVLSSKLLKPAEIVTTKKQ